MLQAGAVLEGRYRVDAVLGQGGMARVYRAHDLEQDRAVALKVVHADAGGRFPPGSVAQIRAEARLLGALRHAGLPRLHGCHEGPEWSALVMDYVPGRTLAAVLADEAPLAEERVLGWTAQICDVLAYLHAQGPPVIFRDLKTGNLILSDGGSVTLIDFGIAKRLDETLRRSTQTTARGMLSRGFAAVEQYLGGTDERSDVYALGAVLFHLLTGQLPPDAMAVARGRVPVPEVRALRPDVSERTARAVSAMMAVDRTGRPPDVAAARAALGLPAGTAAAIPGDAPAPPPRFEERATAADGPPTERWEAGQE